MSCWNKANSSHPRTLGSQERLDVSRGRGGGEQVSPRWRGGAVPSGRAGELQAPGVTQSCPLVLLSGVALPVGHRGPKETSSRWMDVQARSRFSQERPGTGRGDCRSNGFSIPGPNPHPPSVTHQL